MATQKTTYEEIGLVLEAPEFADELVGKYVYFDSWLAKKFPGKNPDTYIWFVKYEDLVAYEPLSE